MIHNNGIQCEVDSQVSKQTRGDLQIGFVSGRSVKLNDQCIYVSEHLIYPFVFPGIFGISLYFGYFWAFWLFPGTWGIYRYLAFIVNLFKFFCGMNSGQLLKLTKTF